MSARRQQRLKQVVQDRADLHAQSQQLACLKKQLMRHGESTAKQPQENMQTADATERSNAAIKILKDAYQGFGGFLAWLALLQSAAAATSRGCNS